MAKKGVFVKQLLIWDFEKVDRDLPWKKSGDLYHIWLAEIMLQQTRVEQMRAYYLNFIHRFPDLKSLAMAQENQVLLAWEGLGYYSRARNLHKCAKKVFYEMGGVFPKTYDALLKLPGIGPYSAAAIASFGYHAQHAVVDGNVVRVLSRFFGIKESFHENEGKKVFFHLAQELLPEGKSAVYNQAIMDFGATVCTPGKAHCTHCSLKLHCYANQHEMQNELPLAKPKTKIRERHFVYFIAHDDKQQKIALTQRKNDDVWRNLYQFPLVEMKRMPSKKSIEKIFPQDKPKFIEKNQAKLSHQTIFIYFYVLNDFKNIHLLQQIDDIVWVNINELSNIALPKKLRQFCNSHLQ